MDILNEFVKYVKLDDEKRILISLHNSYESYLKDSNIRTMLKDTLKNALNENFMKFEVGKNILRVTVKEGTENESMETIKSELVKHLELALSFLSQMQNNN